MTDRNHTEMIPLPQAAQRIGQSWERTWRMLFTGDLQGEKRGGRWFVNAADVETVKSGQANGRTDPLGAA